MNNPRLIAFIGTRALETIDPKAKAEFCKLAIECAMKGSIVVTGAAKGADQLAAESCLAHGGRVQIYLPWESYEQEWTGKMFSAYRDRFRTSCRVSPEAYESLQLHPKPPQPSDPACKLLARNYMIVWRAAAVIALPTPPERGGTGQGMRIARHLGIPCYNLSIFEEAKLTHD